MNNDEDNTPAAPDDGASLPADRLPLGAWLRLVDTLITQEFAAALADAGVSRREWMLLNALSGDVGAPWPAAPSAGPDMRRRRGKTLRRLAERGWIDAVEDGSCTLTDEGRAAREHLSGPVAAVRAKIGDAVSPEEFTALTTSLEAIAGALGWDRSQPFPSPRRGFGRHSRGRGFGDGRGRGQDHEFGGRPEHGRRHGSGREFEPGFGPEHGRRHEFGPECGRGYGDAHGRGHGSAHGFGQGVGFGPAFSLGARHGA
ncbi:hypothetical protein GCM10022240_05150 [Microbacterium kribbense]|uniref:MarR family transcriptional regulator n=1 Tax=Microbacterium kribbense TaxID=433645 RepID=A0ABP7G531_9MICO